jgi:hypothetical protein
VLGEVAGDRARVGVEPTAGAVADDDPDGLAAVEVVLRGRGGARDGDEDYEPVKGDSRARATPWARSC